VLIDFGSIFETVSILLDAIDNPSLDTMWPKYSARTLKKVHFVILQADGD